MLTARVQVPLDAVDLSHVSILYTQGEMAAITPIYDYNFQVRLRTRHFFASPSLTTRSCIVLT